jgi:hypothetical protein
MRWVYLKCPACEWDCVLPFAPPVGCPLCMEDTRRFVLLRQRDATPEDKPEGFDARIPWEGPDA